MFDADRKLPSPTISAQSKLGTAHCVSDDFEAAKNESMYLLQGGTREVNLKYVEGAYGAYCASPTKKLTPWENATPFPSCIISSPGGAMQPFDEHVSAGRLFHIDRPQLVCL
jgi:hypothetical protein